MTDTPHEHDEHDGEGCDHPPLSTRSVARLSFADGSEISVDHLYSAGSEPCPGCGGPCITAGLVGMIVDEESAVMMAPDEALLLADRLHRAADLVLETLEDVPDIEREMIRFASPPPGSP